MSDDKNTYIIETIKELKEDVKDIQSAIHGHIADFRHHEASDRTMANDISAIRRTLEKNTDSLEEHMRRTAAAEAAITTLKDISLKIDSRLAPIEEDRRDHVAMMRIIKKIGVYSGAISAIVTIVYTIWQFSQG